MQTKKIKLSTATGGTPFIKQAPSLKPVWENCEFFINTDVATCDLWVVYGGLAKTEHTRCPDGATLFITNEPPSVKTYAKKFTDQFDAVLTCQNIKHPHVIHTQQALPWWVGHNMRAAESSAYEKTYDELMSLPTPTKTKLLSLIVSNKRFTKGHRRRYAFAKFLKQALGDQIDIFGIDQVVEDKWDAIAPYKYHIVIENSSYDDYWTEKLADAFLGESYPIYYGAPNIEKYFSSEMITSIDITKPQEALRTIQNLIAHDTYERSVTKLAHAKQSILNNYQLFPMLTAYANNLLHHKENSLRTLAPESESSIVKGIKRVWRKIKSIFSRR